MTHGGWKAPSTIPLQWTPGSACLLLSRLWASQLHHRFGDVDHHPQLLNRQLHVVPEQPVGRGNCLWITALHAAHPVGLPLIQFRQHPQAELFSAEHRQRGDSELSLIGAIGLTESPPDGGCQKGRDNRS
ncbi:Hypothetical protein SynWH7803_2119 [Synechococcus sp. WH 7803]|nr:Hypothetical protein SynWH7803_2119 [Synechococcus sp. WH 7803]